MRILCGAQLWQDHCPRSCQEASGRFPACDVPRVRFPIKESNLFFFFLHTPSLFHRISQRHSQSQAAELKKALSTSNNESQTLTNRPEQSSLRSPCRKWCYKVIATREDQQRGCSQKGRERHRKEMSDDDLMCIFFWSFGFFFCICHIEFNICYDFFFSF